MSFEEEKKCPLCAEEMDWTDQQLNPCKCGYEVCVWCWHHIMDMAEKDATEGRCPACRTPYDKDRIVGLEGNFQRVVGTSSSRKQKVTKAKAKPNEGRKDLSNVRVMQRKMAYIIGLPIDLADEDLLQQKEYFGQYGKVTKISLSRTAGGALQQFINDSCSVYITYSKEEEAVRCIQSVHGYVWDGRLLRASFGTAKYCHAWLRNTPCNNPSCLYLHTLGAEEDSFGKDEVAAVHTRNRVQEIVGATHYPHKRSGSMLPPPIVDQLNNHIAWTEDSVCNNGSPDVAHAVEDTSDHLPARSSKQTTTFVDIVGRPSNLNTVKDMNLIEEEHISNVETKSSDSLLLKSSTSDQLVNSPTSDDQILKDSVGSSHSGSSIPSPAANADHSWWHTENNNQTNTYVEEDTIPAPCINSLSNEAYNEKKFQSSAKSDRIYRGANSFSNEEIVEHLRRLDDDTPVDNDENFAAVESSIISNILSMDLDDDNSDYPQMASGLFETRDRRHGSSWNFQNNDQSIFSFGKELGFSSQQNDLVSPGSIGQGLNFSLQDSRENKDDFFKSQQQVASRGLNVGPPGFSMPCKPPPGFSTSMRTEQAIPASSGNYGRVAPKNHYRSPSLGNVSNGSDDHIDLVVGGGKSSTNGMLTNSWTSSFSPRCSSSFEDDLKHARFIQQQPGAVAPNPHHQDPQMFQPTMQQQQTPQFLSSQDPLYGSGHNSGLMDLQQSYNPSLFTQQPMYGSGYQQPNPVQESQQRDNRSAVERFGFESFLPGYGDYMFQMPTSGDVYTRVFGM